MLSGAQVTEAIYTYDAINRITELEWTGSIPMEFTLTRNTSGNITGITREHGSYTLTYDDVDQLLTSATSGTGSFVNYNRTLGYDLLGNRSSDSVNGAGSFVANFLTGNSTSSFTADVDGFGDVATENTGSVTKTFGYRGDGKLVSFSDGTVGATYFYDALGRRVAKSITGSGTFTQSFTYLDKEDKILLGKSGNGTTTVYLDGQGLNDHLGEVTGSTVKGYVTDHLGSVMNSSLAGSNYQYGLFGEVATPPTISPSINPVMYGWQGLAYDAESGLWNNQARQYHANIGRFLSQDPIGIEDDLNLYRSRRNNPVFNTDPTGEFAVEVGAGVTAFLGIGLGANKNLAFSFDPFSGEWQAGTSTNWQVKAGYGAYAGAGVVGALTLGPSNLCDLAGSSYGVGADIGTGFTSIGGQLTGGSSGVGVSVSTPLGVGAGVAGYGLYSYTTVDVRNKGNIYRKIGGWLGLTNE